MKDMSSEMSQTLKRIEKILLVLVTLLIKIKHYYYDSLLLVFVFSSLLALVSLQMTWLICVECWDW